MPLPGSSTSRTLPGAARHRGGPGCGEVTLCPKTCSLAARPALRGRPFCGLEGGFSTRKKEGGKPAPSTRFLFGASWNNMGRKPEKEGESMQHSRSPPLPQRRSGGIAVVRLSGRRAMLWHSRCSVRRTRPSVQDAKGYTALVRQFCGGTGRVLTEGVAFVLPGAHSYYRGGCGGAVLSRRHAVARRLVETALPQVRRPPRASIPAALS